MAKIRQFLNTLFHMELHWLLFLVFLLFLPFQTRILYFSDQAYVSWYFNYHLASFIYLSDILLIACFTAWVVSRPNLWLWHRANKAVVALLILVFITLFHVERLNLGLYQAFKWLEWGFVLTYIYTTFINRAYFKSAVGILFVGAVFQAIMGWLQFHMQHMVGLSVLGEYIAPFGTSGLSTIDTAAGKIIRAYGTMPHPNVLGAFLVLGLIIGLYFVSHETVNSKQRTVNRILILIGLTMILVGLFMTFSRTAWLAAAIAMIAYTIFYWIKQQWSIIIVIIIASLVSCATIALLYRPYLQARINHSDQRAITDRADFNQVGLALIKDHPIFGVGIGNYIPAMLDNYQLEPWQYQPPHNIFIFIAAELGLIGLILFLWLLFTIIKNSWSKNILSDPLIFSCFLLLFAILLMGQLDHYFVTIQQGRLMFAVALGLLAALPNLELTNPNDRIVERE